MPNKQETFNKTTGVCEYMQSPTPLPDDSLINPHHYRQEVAILTRALRCVESLDGHEMPFLCGYNLDDAHEKLWQAINVLNKCHDIGEPKGVPFTGFETCDKCGGNGFV